MAERGKTVGEQVNTWAQTIGIAAAFGWGVFTFWKSDMSTPVAATVTIAIRPAGKGSGHRQSRHRAFELTFTATNPNTREIALLPSAWIATGYAMRRRPESMTFEHSVRAALASVVPVYAQSGFVLEQEVLAAGQLFGDNSLKPQEMTRTSVVIAIPDHECDVLDVQAAVPSTLVPGRYALSWQVRDGSLVPSVFKTHRDGTREPLQRDADGGYSSRTELQLYRAGAEESLWGDSGAH
jgi:hypothetical protein